MIPNGSRSYELRRLHDNLGFDFCDESIDCFLTFQGDTLALFDFIEPLLRRPPQQFEFRRPFPRLLFQETQRFAEDFARVAVAA
jgi:hypothetical protein